MRIATIVVTLLIVINTSIAGIIDVYAQSNVVKTNSYFNSNNSASKSVAKKSISEQVDALVNGKRFDANTVLVKYKTDKANFAVTEKLSAKEKLKVKIKELSNSIKQVGGEFSSSAKSKNTSFRLAVTASDKAAVAATLKSYLSDPNVEMVQPNYLYDWNWTSTATTAKPSDWNDTEDWYLAKSKVPEMWKDQACPSVTCGGANTVKVAIIDSGLAYENFNDTTGFSGVNHISSPEYDGINLYNNIGETANDGLDNDCNGLVDDKNGADAYAWGRLAATDPLVDTCNASTPIAVPTKFRKVGHANDIVGHGSLVTGMVAGEVENGDGASPAFNVRILPLNVAISEKDNPYFGSPTSTAVINALILSVYYDVDVTNLSLGFGGPDSLVEFYIDYAYTAGITIVAASGNAGTASLDYPAAYDQVIAVGSLNSDDSKSSYSQYGAGLDVMAYVGDSNVAITPTSVYQSTLTCFPGCVAATLDDGVGYETSQGTSFASPQVTALAALIKSKYPTYTPANIKDTIIKSAKDVGTVGFDNLTGYGAVDFYKAFHIIGPTGTISTNTGSATTATQAVNLTLTNNDDPTSSANVDMQISNTADFAGAVWEDFVSPKAWNLTPGNDIKTVYIKYKDLDGNISATYTDTIELYDTTLISKVYRLRNIKQKVHLYTISYTEKDNVNAHPDWEYEGQAYNAYRQTQGDTKPVYRSYNSTTKRHLYTMGEAEKAKLEARLDWKLEGVGYHAYEATGASRLPLYRFYSESRRAHLYTANETEKANIIANASDVWRYEGITYYVK